MFGFRVWGWDLGFRDHRQGKENRMESNIAKIYVKA